MTDVFTTSSLCFIGVLYLNNLCFPTPPSVRTTRAAQPSYFPDIQENTKQSNIWHNVLNTFANHLCCTKTNLSICPHLISAINSQKYSNHNGRPNPVHIKKNRIFEHAKYDEFHCADSKHAHIPLCLINRTNSIVVKIHGFSLIGINISLFIEPYLISVPAAYCIKWNNALCVSLVCQSDSLNYVRHLIAK